MDKLTISNLFLNNDIAPLEEITIKIDGIRNPPSTKPLEGFQIYTTDSNNYKIDEHQNQSLTVSLPPHSQSLNPATIPSN